MSRPNYKVRIKQKRHSTIIFMSLFIFASTILVNISYAEAASQEPNSPANESLREPPIIIWGRNGEGKSNEALKEALSSGLITHVFVSYRSRKDGAWNSKPWIREAIKIVKQSDAKLIWSRNLWAWYAVEGAKFEDMMNPFHYAKEIENVRAEAKEMGADFTALDVEPYANSPMRKYMLGKKRIKLSAKEYQQLKNVIKQVLRLVDKVDFIIPSGWWGYSGHNHPFDIFAELGKIRVCTNTYYDNANSIKAVPYPYDIFGVHLNTIKYHERNPIDPHFLAPEIFERSQLWSHKKGLFIYTSIPKSLDVARELVAYSKTLPLLSAADPNGRNTP